MSIYNQITDQVTNRVVEYERERMVAVFRRHDDPSEEEFQIKEIQKVLDALPTHSRCQSFYRIPVPNQPNLVSVLTDCPHRALELLEYVEAEPVAQRFEELGTFIIRERLFWRCEFRGKILTSNSTMRVIDPLIEFLPRSPWQQGDPTEYRMLGRDHTKPEKEKLPDQEWAASQARLWAVESDMDWLNMAPDGNQRRRSCGFRRGWELFPTAPCAAVERKLLEL